MEHHADTIFLGERIYCRGVRDSRAETVAVRGGVVVAVGRDAALQLKGPRTEVVELGERALLPGFIDSHIHAVHGGLTRVRCDLSEVHTLEEYRALISDYARRHDGPWVEGAGWYGDLFPNGFPTKAVLDGVVSDRPAVFTSHDMHSLWVNSRALEVAGIDRDTPDPEGGRIVRDADGEPTGLLMERAMSLLDEFRPAIDLELTRDALLSAERYLHSLGITSWQDALVGNALGLADTYEVYRDASNSGLLRSRVTGALYWQPGGAVSDIERFTARREQTAGNRFRTTAIKFLLDGNCENLTAAVHEAYVGHPSERGALQYGVEEFSKTARALSDAGFDLHLHAVGDLAVTRALDAVAGIEERGDRRHQIAHIDLIAREDLTRMRELGVIANVTPLWARLDPVLVETKLPLLTDDQQSRHFAYGSMQASGIELAFGSDWPVSTPDPVAQIHTAVHRTAAPGDPHAHDERSRTEPLLLREQLSLDAALAAFTRNSAHASRQDEFVGTIEVGKEADLVLLDRDPHGVDSTELATLSVERTFVKGETVYPA